MSEPAGLVEALGSLTAVQHRPELGGDLEPEEVRVVTGLQVCGRLAKPGHTARKGGLSFFSKTAPFFSETPPFSCGAAAAFQLCCCCLAGSCWCCHLPPVPLPSFLAHPSSLSPLRSGVRCLCPALFTPHPFGAFARKGRLLPCSKAVPFFQTGRKGTGLLPCSAPRA